MFSECIACSMTEKITKDCKSAHSSLLRHSTVRLLIIGACAIIILLYTFAHARAYGIRACAQYTNCKRRRGFRTLVLFIQFGD